MFVREADSVPELKIGHVRALWPDWGRGFGVLRRIGDDDRPKRWGPAFAGMSGDLTSYPHLQAFVGQVSFQVRYGDGAGVEDAGGQGARYIRLLEHIAEMLGRARAA